MSKFGLQAAAVLAAGTVMLAACGGQSGQPSGSNSAPGNQQYDITMIVGVTGDDGYATDVCGAKSIVEKNPGVTLDVQGPTTFAPAPQTQVLNAAIAKKPDAIIIAPTDVKAMIAPIKRAKAAGIKVILFDTTLADLSDVETVVGVDNPAGGKLAAETMAKIIGEKGKVFTNNVNPGISTTDGRQTGFEEGIKAYPDITYLGVQFNNDNVTKAASITTSVLAANPDLAGVYGTNLFSVQGAVAGLRNAGKVGEVTVVGFDAAEPQVKLLKDGSVQALIAQDLFDMGAKAMEATLDVLNGKPVEKDYKVGFTALTKDNIDTPEGQAKVYKSECS